ncbi:cell wall-associated protein [Bacillus cereus]|nr:cell wall-associated protein [Bacillus cereus]
MRKIDNLFQLTEKEYRFVYKRIAEMVDMEKSLPEYVVRGDLDKYVLLFSGYDFGDDGFIDSLKQIGEVLGERSAYICTKQTFRYRTFLFFTKSGYYNEDVKKAAKFDVNISSEDYWDIITWQEEKDGEELGVSLRDHNVLYILFSSGKVLLVIDVRDEVALLISEKDIYRDQMIDATIWQPLSDFLIVTEEYHQAIFRDGGKRYRKALVENYAGL